MAHMHTIRAHRTGPVLVPNRSKRRPHTSGGPQLSLMQQCSFRDVNCACTEWLLKNDPSFIRQHAASQELHARKQARKAGEPLPEDGTADTIGRFPFGSNL